MKKQCFILLIFCLNSFFSISQEREGSHDVKRLIKKQVKIAIELSELKLSSSRATHFKRWDKVINKLDTTTSNIGDDLELFIELNVTYLIKVSSKHEENVLILFYFDGKGKLIDCFTNDNSEEYYDKLMIFLPSCGLDRGWVDRNR